MECNISLKYDLMKANRNKIELKFEIKDKLVFLILGNITLELAFQDNHLVYCPQ